MIFPFPLSLPPCNSGISLKCSGLALYSIEAYFQGTCKMFCLKMTIWMRLTQWKLQIIHYTILYHPPFPPSYRSFPVSLVTLYKSDYWFNLLIIPKCYFVYNATAYNLQFSQISFWCQLRSFHQLLIVQASIPICQKSFQSFINVKPSIVLY
jgi:hypothetical protein